MTTGKITLQGHILVPAERLAEIRAALPAHIALTRKEAGCLVFQVVEAETPVGRFDVYEEFADRASFDAHQTRGANSAWAQIAAGIPREYQITEDGE